MAIGDDTALRVQGQLTILHENALQSASARRALARWITAVSQLPHCNGRRRSYIELINAHSHGDLEGNVRQV
ncbi:hypothetical protein BKA12_000902 [Neomicrococcus lactis]|uniref:Uncharacterized protein n=1 Tax=Neomicrococcus lactis TaxID=732241 RepID=A0A7W8YAG6_9MICC|nr:hypothetical protein [Neomicrococcus lactis]